MKVQHALVREGRGGPGGGARVHPAQPPARLPGVRQGRRVPAAGPDVPLRAGQDALPRSTSAPTRSRSPISPSIVLDRERCILCYRCTRFSQDVAQDEQLIARERGAAVGHRDVRGAALPRRFSGNVIELCPVGALTSTTYRFKARPWEIDNMPSVCGMCPVGCNTWATVREGGVERVLSRNHPEVDEGWLCDRGRFAHDDLLAGDRYAQGLVRGPRGLEPVRAPRRLAETIARRLRHHATLHGARLDRRRGLGRAEQRGGLRLGRARARRRRRRARRQPASRRGRRLGRARRRTRRASPTSTAPT